MKTKTVDILVVGSGAGAMTSALVANDGGADVLVVEKAPLWGGTSASSGGGIWIPCSPLAKAEGAEDSPQEAFTYIKSLTGEDVADEKIKAFIDKAPKMLSYLLEKSDVRFRAQPYADYHTDNPGAKLGYRMHEPVEVMGDALGKDYYTLQETHPIAMLFGRIGWIISESYPVMTRAPGWKWTLFKMMARYYLDFPHRLKTTKDRRLTMGKALSGRLKLSLNERDVPVWLDAPMKRLIVEDGAVVGALVEREGESIRVIARKGVVLGAGGFERNDKLRAEYLPGATTSTYTASTIYNTGDAIVAGANIGAKLDIMDTAWWAPGYRFEGDDRAYPMFVERALPGSMIVNQKARRYMNEAASYHVAGGIMANENSQENPTIPSWFIFDATFRAKYAVGPILPLGPGSDMRLPRKVKKQLKIARTIEELASKTGLDKEALQETTNRMNGFAASGVDEDFNRGGFDYDRYYGDPNIGPNTCLGPIVKPPFYALPIYPADIGTKGGLLTDENSQVVDQDDRPIRGLYAIGNSSASVMGRSYPGAGATIGPAMTFGYVAARHALGINEE